MPALAGPPRPQSRVDRSGGADKAAVDRRWSGLLLLWGCAHREPSDPAKRLVDQGLAQLERHQWEEAEQS